MAAVPVHVQLMEINGASGNPLLLPMKRVSYVGPKLIEEKVDEIPQSHSVTASMFLHDGSLLKVTRDLVNGVGSFMPDKHGPAKIHGRIVHILRFTHVVKDGMISEWDCFISSMDRKLVPFMSKLKLKQLEAGIEVSKDETETLVVGFSRKLEPIPSLQQCTEWLWLTLYWYFQCETAPSPRKVPKPGAPTKEWTVNLEGSKGPNWGTIFPEFLYDVERMGLVYCSSTTAQRSKVDRFFISSKTFWQIPPDIFYRSSYVPGSIVTSHPLPLHYSLPSSHNRHPLRPRAPAPGATIYTRYIPSLKSFLTFRTADMTTDVPILHKWMNDVRVNDFWGEAGPLTYQEKFLQNGMLDNHCFPVIGSWRDLSSTDSANGQEGVESTSGVEEPFGYFEIYWVKEDKLAGYTEVADWDRGVHALVGEEKYRGSHRVKVWLSSLVHCKSHLKVEGALGKI